MPAFRLEAVTYFLVEKFKYLFAIFPPHLFGTALSIIGIQLMVLIWLTVESYCWRQRKGGLNEEGKLGPEKIHLCGEGSPAGFQVDEDYRDGISVHETYKVSLKTTQSLTENMKTDFLAYT